jgi:oxysterol-binding protein-related protein 9/10/11
VVKLQTPFSLPDHVQQCNWELNADAAPFTDPANAPPQAPVDPMDKSKQNLDHPITLSYMTEQTSHHPPVSAYYMECPERGIIGYGYDQLSAKFTGTAVRVIPGNFNQGIFVKLTERDEEYQLTHPAANLSGLLKGSLYISVADTCTIYCRKTKIKVILTYAEEGWLGRAQNKVFAVVFRYDPDNDKYTRIKDVPEKDVLARVEGSWQEQIFYWLAGDKKAEKDPSARQLLMDVSPLMPVPKICPPPEEQLVNESRLFWKDLTAAIQEKRFGDANRVKQAIEQAQRDKAAERKSQGITWKPRFFQEVTDPDGRPHLNDEGVQLMKGLQTKDFKLAEPEVTAA